MEMNRQEVVQGVRAQLWRTTLLLAVVVAGSVIYGGQMYLVVQGQLEPDVLLFTGGLLLGILVKALFDATRD